MRRWLNYLKISKKIFKNFFLIAVSVTVALTNGFSIVGIEIVVSIAAVWFVQSNVIFIIVWMTRTAITLIFIQYINLVLLMICFLFEKFISNYIVRFKSLEIPGIWCALIILWSLISIIVWVLIHCGILISICFFLTLLIGSLFDSWVIFRFISWCFRCIIT